MTHHMSRVPVEAARGFATFNELVKQSRRKPPFFRSVTTLYDGNRRAAGLKWSSVWTAPLALCFRAPTPYRWAPARMKKPHRIARGGAKVAIGSQTSIPQHAVGAALLVACRSLPLGE
jgi:hypothetical protein